jgi:hypothetical protein
MHGEKMIHWHSSETLRVCLGFIYDGYTFLKDAPLLILFEIYTFADQLHLEDLKMKALSYIDSFQTKDAASKISPKDLCGVFCHENCDKDMELKVTNIIVKKIDTPSSLLWIHLLAQAGITKKEAPKVWETLEKVVDKEAYGLYWLFRKIKEENESNIGKLTEKSEQNEAMKKELEFLKHQLMKE